jgi:hypothetical protein
MIMMMLLGGLHHGFIGGRRNPRTAFARIGARWNGPPSASAKAARKDRLGERSSQRFVWDSALRRAELDVKHSYRIRTTNGWTAIALAVLFLAGCTGTIGAPPTIATSGAPRAAPPPAPYVAQSQAINWRR